MLALRPLLRTAHVPFRRQITPLHRTMASSTTAPLQEWLVIIQDHPGALSKRIEVRGKHLEGLKADREDMWLWGGTLPFTLSPVSPILSAYDSYI